jgi:protein O-mannosyl-transferase
VRGDASILRVARSRRSRKSLHPEQAQRSVDAVGVGQLSSRGRLWSLAAAVALVSALVYLPSLDNGFTNWDDPRYILDNEHLEPLDGHFLTWAFTTFRMASWNPLLWLSFGLDRALVGLDPFGYHLTNVLLHCATTLVVVLVVAALFARARSASGGQNLLAAGVAGVIFAVHPLHVESVAWVTGRKDVLFGVFYVLALLCYIRFAECLKKTQYFLSLGMFALALLAKPMAVSLPLVLLVIDAYPLGRLSKLGWPRVLLEKLPFAVLSVASSVVTVVAQWGGGAAARHMGLAERFWVAERALGFYLSKAFLPLDLVPMYPLDSRISPWRWDFLSSFVLVVAASVAAVLLRRRVPVISALWAAYVAILLPAICVVLGQQAAADRHMYLPLLVPAIGMAAAAVSIWQAGRNARAAVMVTALGTTVVLSILTVHQARIWHDSATLWEWVIEKQPNAAMAHYNLGEYLREKGDLDRAGQCWQRAAEIEPSFSWPLNQLGNLAALRGKLDEARSYYERATRVNMYDAEAQLNFATLLEDQGQVVEARAHYEIFLRVAPPELAHLLPDVQERLSLLGRP